jgi:hypothetical protein
VAQFDPTAEYGFYLKVGSGSGAVYYTQSQLNPVAEQQHQHFAIFQQDPSGKFWIGAEDLSLAQLGGSEDRKGDYNDMVICITPIPEPRGVTLAVLTTLFFGLVAYRRRKT